MLESWQRQVDNHVVVKPNAMLVTQWNAEELHPDFEGLLWTQDEILARCKEIGKEISQDLRDEYPILVAVMTGAQLFFSDLVKHVSIPCTLDFLSASSYGASTTSAGTVSLAGKMKTEVKGRNVVIVEDMVDTGLTIKTITDTLREQGAKSVRTVTLLDKPTGRTVEVPVDYRAFECPDKFVVGYGLDFDEDYRQIPYIGWLKPCVYVNRI
ncbi:MAG: uncharacterized protein KVP18_000579 [Porospora cf. gigantea A]|uniref:uncharacterized protein n=2 Tax=Porospora cf. gigantea A TaxID=2853593 RepID=UPI003559A775|nr:MAG: hypothetical protein KVP18_000579 [Porospora cf. gigantea A]